MKTPSAFTAALAATFLAAAACPAPVRAARQQTCTEHIINDFEACTPGARIEGQCGLTNSVHDRGCGPKAVARGGSLGTVAVSGSCYWAQGAQGTFAFPDFTAVTEGTTTYSFDVKMRSGCCNKNGNVGFHDFISLGNEGGGNWGAVLYCVPG